MKIRDLIEFILLAALWGGSFLFMRIAAPEFGAIPLVGIRVGVGALVLTAFAYHHQLIKPMARQPAYLWLMGLLNSAIPFCLFAYASLYLSAGVNSLLNATAPLWTAFIAWLWMKEPLHPRQIIGLLTGFSGVFVVVSNTNKFLVTQAWWAVLAALGATLLYGLAANMSKRIGGSTLETSPQPTARPKYRVARYSGSSFTLSKLRFLRSVLLVFGPLATVVQRSPLAPLAVATGSQLGAFVSLAPAAVWYWPDHPPSHKAWGAAILLGIACTALAYLLFFRLIQKIGTTKTVSVTFLIPLFGILWGYCFLDEKITLSMLLGGSIILIGTALTMAKSVEKTP